MDEAPGAAPVAILSYGFWERRFGKNPAASKDPSSPAGAAEAQRRSTRKCGRAGHPHSRLLRCASAAHRLWKMRPGSVYAEQQQMLPIESDAPSRRGILGISGPRRVRSDREIINGLMQRGREQLQAKFDFPPSSAHLSAIVRSRVQNQSVATPWSSHCRPPTFYPNNGSGGPTFRHG